MEEEKLYISWTKFIEYFLIGYNKKAVWKSCGLATVRRSYAVMPLSA
jgi:hypothetical protein